MSRIDFLFYTQVRQAVDTMRSSGMGEVDIACVLADIRAAAINEERFRLEKLLRANPPYHPPYHPPFGEIVKELETCIPLNEKQIGVKSTS